MGRSVSARTGRATRSAERTIRSMFNCGRNKRGVPSGPRYACKAGRGYIRIFHGDVRVGHDLQAFEDVRAVVEARARRVQIEWSVWFDLWWGPSTFRREVHVEHVVCRDLSN